VCCLESKDKILNHKNEWLKLESVFGLKIKSSLTGKTALGILLIS
jgi:hypothetical protein